MYELGITILFVVEQTEAQNSRVTCPSQVVKEICLGPKPALYPIPNVLPLYTLRPMIQVGASGEKQPPFLLYPLYFPNSKRNLSPDHSKRFLAHPKI